MKNLIASIVYSVSMLMLILLPYIGIVFFICHPGIVWWKQWLYISTCVAFIFIIKPIRLLIKVTKNTKNNF